MKHKIFSVLMVSAFLAFPVTVPAADYSSLSSKDVQIIQQALADSGFYRAGVDGFYGPATVNAIRSFQASKGLTMTGRLDEATLRELSPQFASSKQIPDPQKVTEFVVTEQLRADQARMERQARVRDDRIAPQDIAPASGTATILNDKMTTRYPNTQRISTSDVQAIQQTLREAGYYQGAHVDGIWGKVTTRAVRDFQADKGLNVTGTATQETRDALGL
jgi:peptidoglycan hydrolase-like protein with peptidoglycan-binding domain